MATPERIAKWRVELAKHPETAEALNDLFWIEVAARVAEISDEDQRNQAQHHFEMLLTFLGGEECEAS